MASFRIYHPELENLSDAERLLLQCIQELGESHAKKIGKVARLKADPSWIVKVKEVTQSDTGLPLIHIDAVSYEGKPIVGFSLRLKALLSLPATCWEGELDFSV
ncbi:MAG: hypothetical protein CL840_00030 [Crocinitomicaceae bacterium]|nr:hypothetical protein [Crocinitomicaceae bacterium]|tara:strand:+ start:29276 stop:29587 length:312 start_codon:yes stop_codon:yes gene_type:complete